MNIRLEKTEDYREVENLTREAFWNVYRPGCTEHYVLNQYRTNPDFIPELDFVMEEDRKIIGHVMFSKAEITLDDGTPYPSWTFGPISCMDSCLHRPLCCYTGMQHHTLCEWLPRVVMPEVGSATIFRRSFEATERL